jgi:geranylgeranyl pyrophosphate synthase
MFSKDRFNQELIQSFLLRQGPSSRLRDAILYALASPGKRLRPRLAHESASRFGLNHGVTTTFARSIELVHLFSLVHDDLPALDDDDFRRGQPTLHRQFDEGIALLAGDELLQFAHETFLELISGVDPRSFQLALRAFHSAIGRDGMIGGQALELQTPAHEMTLDSLIRIQTLKTGALFKAAVVVPAILSGKSETDPTIADLEEFALAFGFAFQIADDLQDEEQDRQESAKNILGLMGRPAAIELALKRLTETRYFSGFSPAQELAILLESEKRRT